MIRKIGILAAVLAVLIGLLMMLIPHLQSEAGEQAQHTAAQAWLDAHTSSTAPQSEQIPNPTTETEVPYPELLAAMQAYNERLRQEAQAQLGYIDYTTSGISPEDYGVSDGIVGVLSIPSIDVSMPLFLGASYQHLVDGVAQLPETSMPTGGKDTNCVICGHRGWTGIPYLREIDKVRFGDTVTLQTLWGTLTYKVVETAIIEPGDRTLLKIREGRDLLTICTCHPYAVCTQRYLLICERVPGE